MKKITLTQRKFTLIDDRDFKRVSKYKWFAHKNPRRATIQVDGKNISIGTFRSEEAANRAFRKTERKCFGEFARK